MARLEEPVRPPWQAHTGWAAGGAGSLVQLPRWAGPDPRGLVCFQSP